jgi:YhcH/YjgK/YiaL family protein
MAIFGSFPTVSAQLVTDARFAAAQKYVADLLDPQSAAHHRIKQIAAGTSQRIELAGGAYAMEQVYLTKTRPEGFFESHRKYIDVQVIVEGEEVMEVEEISRLAVSEAFNEKRDLIKYGDTARASRLNFRPGDAGVYFPEDGHMPGLQVAGAVLVRKTVVKVPVA